MENKNPLILPVKGSTLERAIINILNKISNDMYDEHGKLKFMQKNIDENKEDADTKIGNETTQRSKDVSDLCDMILTLTEE